MPKRNHIIPRFNGLILDIAKEDLPDGVLANNTKNAHFDQSGNLVGFTPPQTYLSTGITSPIYSGKIKSKTGTKLFHIEQAVTRRIKTYSPPSTTVETTNFPHNNVTKGKVSHAQRMNHVVFGTGNGSANKPVWFGTHNHTQFGSAPSATPQCLDAELVSPTQLSSTNSFPRARSAVRSNSRTYMISPDSNQVFKFNGVNKELESVVRFQNLVAICEDSTAGFIWVYDRQSSTLFRLNSSLLVTNSIFLSGLPDDGKLIIDIAVAGGWIWLLRDFSEKDYNPMVNYLYRVSRSTSTTSQVPIDNSYREFSQTTFNPIDHARADRISLSETNIRFGEKGLVVKGSDIHVVMKLSTRWEYQFEREYDEQGDYQQQNDYSVINNNLILFSAATPVGDTADVTGNTIVLKAEPVDTPGVIPTGNVNLMIGNKTATVIDELSFDANYLYIFNYSFQDAVTQVRVSLIALTGDVAITATVSSIAGYGINNIQPVIAMSGGTGYFFNAHSPAKTGIMTGTSLMSITESISSLSIEAIPGGFTELERSYYYAFSFIYDGYMESPLSDFISASAEEGFGFLLKLRVPASNINRRVSAVNIYRASGSQFGREEFFRLIDSVSMETNFPTETVDGQNTRVIEYTDRKSEFELGPSFDANAGFPEALKNTMVHYGMSAMIDDYLFVGDCYHPSVDEAAYMIFRSQAYSICSFNYEVDVLRLPLVPTAMVSMGNRLLVFDESDMHVVDPANMYIEETVYGFGAINTDCVKKFRNGIVVAGKNALAIYSGGSIQIPSERITLHPGANLSAFSANPSADSFNALRDYRYLAQNGTDLHLTVDEKTSQIYMLGVISGSTIGYIYNYATEQWSRYVNNSYSLVRSQDTDDHYLLAYRSASVDYLFGDDHPESAGQTYIAELVPFDANDANIDKWYYEIRVDYLGSAANISVRVSADHQAYSSALAQSNGVFTIPKESVHRQGKELRVRIEGSVKIKSVSIIFRPKQVRS